MTHRYVRIVSSLVVAAGFALLPAFAWAATYYVATTGDNANPGTLAAPLRTIQKAAERARPGDRVLVRGGVYRETVRPAQSGTAAAPITFQPYNGEAVTITGADLVTDWEPYRGAIYTSRTMDWDLGEGKNQVFVDGHMMTEARWPNTGT